MARFILACLLAELCLQPAVAAEPARSTASRYVAKIKFVRVEEGRQLIAVDTEVTGTKGTPLKAVLGDKNGLVLKLDMQDLPGGYVARIVLVDTNNGREAVLCRPRIMTAEGVPATIRVGGLEVDLLVRAVAEGQQ
jgi:hypothetical protein